MKYFRIFDCNLKTMNDKEIKQLTDLAKRLQVEKPSKEGILASFVAAGILTKEGKFTKPYASLNALKTEQVSA